jgi:hypothetical protein
MKTSIKRINTTVYTFAMIAAGLLLIFGCNSDETTGPQDLQIVDIAISPENAEFEVGEQLEFSAVALTATGETVDISDLDISWEWWSTDPDVFTVEAGGMATAHNTGEAWCVVEAVIDVSLNQLNQSNEKFVRASIFPFSLWKNNTNNPELNVFEEASFNNMLRFTGRDSAFVMIF